MAVLDTLEGVHSSSHNRMVVEIIKLIDGATATGNGEWIDTTNAFAISFDIQGITTATVQINGSNESTAPANTDHGRQITTATANGFVTLERHQIPRWLKARVSAYTSGTITVWAKIWRTSY